MHYEKACDLVTFKTGKLDSNAAEEEGKYPFFTCAQTTYRINSYAFDTECVLLAGNNAGGIFPLKYYKGKFNAYQRTYIIQSRNAQVLNIKYLYFYLRPYLKAFEQEATGATTKFLTLKILNNLRVALPPVGVQEKIAAVLSTYDDLIENNRRRIELLEQMAEELYREWFARFRFPGYQQAKFEKGIPAGWVVAELSKLAEVNARSIRKSREPQKVHYLDIGCVSTNEYTLPESIDFNNAPGRARRIVKHGDIIWSSVRPANRAYCLIYDPPENLVASTGFAVISHRQQVPYSFLKMAVTTDSFVEQMTVVAKGSAYPATSFEDFEKAKILLPPDGLLKEFDRHVEPLLKKINKLSKEDHILRQCRELLLPRLISGKLPVDQLDIQFPPSMREAAAARQEVAHA
ncbi:restriction endonuclease subunit S [Pseudomonas sp.]|uniref:restriction endonuclease subunit S n=1 Tax=Pseudomonas sp. TaxID=306 RepID=UPI002CA4320A|nr:restriction endonuclease subunit S [Pseudomonas sp.]HUE92507.1 restriction endonuclease subunit S [Pseudomonas sp.]